MPILLGHRRLAMPDRSEAGAQPMISSCGRYVVVSDGEIYNLAQLRAAVEHERGRIAWRGHCDTEVLVEAIGVFGVRRLDVGGCRMDARPGGASVGAALRTRGLASS